MNSLPIPSIRLLCVILLGLLCASGYALSESTTYTWTGLTSDNENPNSLYNSGNWLNENTPPDDEWYNDEDIFGIHLLFGDSRRTFIEYYELYANQIEFRDISRPYYLQGIYDTTHIGSGGIIYDPGQNFWSTISDTVQLHASQTWAINAGTLSISGNISDSISYDPEIYGDYSIEKTGAGTLQLSGSYSGAWAGGLTISEGLVIASTDLNNTLEGALGFGTLTFNGGALEIWPSYYSYYGEYGVWFTNNIVSNGLIDLRTETEVVIANADQPENFIRLDADTTLKVSGDNLLIEKNIIENEGTGPHSLTVDSYAAIIHYGSSGWTGGTNIHQGIFIFGGENNIPVTPSGITVGSSGYVGIGADNDVTTFLSKINLSGSSGAIGFDSDTEDESIPDSFTDIIDLTGANASLRLGSASEAILGDLENMSSSSEQIIPAGENYRFGSGGGSLYVASLLTNGQSSRGIEVDSHPDMPLTVWLINPNNDFTGDVYVNNSALIYGPGVAPDVEADRILTSTGYVGTAETEMGTDWLDYFPSDTEGIIGFDVFPGDENPEPWVIENLDTGAFSSAAIGSATQVYDEEGDFNGPGLILTGTISPNSDGSHRFVAYKGGAVMVSGTLTGSSLHIGRPDSIATFGDRFREEYSTVLISGDNGGALANGTTLDSGRLMVGQSNGTPGEDPTTALGQGLLTIGGALFTEGDDGDAPAPQLVAAVDDLIIPNNIYIGAEELGVGGDRDFILAGNISGTGKLYIGEDSGESDGSFHLGLYGDNDFSGGIYISNNSSLTVGSNTGTGTGPLSFGFSGGSVDFETSAPVIGGFGEGDGSSAYIDLSNESPTTLTINQQDFGRFTGTIDGHEATVIKSGPGTLRLDGAEIYTDGIADGQGNNIGLDITQGTLIFSNGAGLYASGEIQAPAVKLSGGTFAVDGGTTFNNPVVVGNGGRLAGFGTYSQDVSIGDGAILSPGLAGNGMTGSIQFHHLELDGGGIYEFNIQDPDFSDYIGRDIISVHNPDSGAQTLVINANADHPFIIQVVSLDPSGHAGMLDGIDEGHGLYSWTLINFDVLSIPGNGDVFDPDFFDLDLTAFTSDALYGGDFSIFLNGNQIMLGFTPVPEPSTYAMLGVGLGIVAWTLRRRRFRK